MEHARCVEEGEDAKTKGIDNLFNRIKVEKFPTSFNRESPRCRKLTEQQTIRTKGETPSDTS
jgi:hypothetical protein